MLDRNPTVNTGVDLVFVSMTVNPADIGGGITGPTNPRFTSKFNLFTNKCPSL